MDILSNWAGEKCVRRSWGTRQASSNAQQLENKPWKCHLCSQILRNCFVRKTERCASDTSGRKRICCLPQVRKGIVDQSARLLWHSVVAYLAAIQVTRSISWIVRGTHSRVCMEEAMCTGLKAICVAESFKWTIPAQKQVIFQWSGSPWPTQFFHFAKDYFEYFASLLIIVLFFVRWALRKGLIGVAVTASETKLSNMFYWLWKPMCNRKSEKSFINTKNRFFLVVRNVHFTVFSWSYPGRISLLERDINIIFSSLINKYA